MPLILNGEINPDYVWPKRKERKEKKDSKNFDPDAHQEDLRKPNAK